MLNDLVSHNAPFTDVSSYPAGHIPAVDTEFQKYYDSIIQMEGDLYGAGQAAKATYDRRAEADADAGENRTRTANAERSGIQEAVGETGKGSAEIHLPGGQHRGLTASGGMAEILTIDREHAKENRRRALAGMKKSSEYDLDEYPPAMFKEGGEGASVRQISPSDNRGAGSVIGHQLRGYPDGTKIKIKIVD